MEEKLSFEEVAKIVFENEQENGLHKGLTFSEWLEGKQLEAAGSFTIPKESAKIAKVAAVTKDENDFSELIKAVNGLYPMSMIMRCIHFLNKKNVGKVTEVRLIQGRGDLIGIVWGTNGNYRLHQTVRYSVKGREHMKMNVEKV